ncbi:nuclear transport factor 2 family protein [Microbacterium sp. AZCO]|uniref:YybH family protein n=1 Tax=Microbacterium sp. AZCO TaxID=3142976 RepID=UPI0031F3F7CD
MSTETEEFLAEMIHAQSAADAEIHNGDPAPRIALWSHRDPVSLFGANLTTIGWSQVEPSFHEVASWFSGSIAWDFEIVHAHASGDLAYTVAFENSEAITGGAPRKYRLRVTHLYRREDGVWKIIHRHADFEPDSTTPLFDEGQP